MEVISEEESGREVQRADCRTNDRVESHEAAEAGKGTGEKMVARPEEGERRIRRTRRVESQPSQLSALIARVALYAMLMGCPASFTSLFGTSMCRIPLRYDALTLLLSMFFGSLSDLITRPNTRSERK